MLPLLMCVFILSWPIAQVLAVDPREADLVPIGTVFADPQHYNLKSVRFQGTITGILSYLFREAAERSMAIRFSSQTRQETSR